MFKITLIVVSFAYCCCGVLAARWVRGETQSLALVAATFWFWPLLVPLIRFSLFGRDVPCPEKVNPCGG